MQPEREERGPADCGRPGFALGVSSPLPPGLGALPSPGDAVIPGPRLPLSGSSCGAVSLPPLVPASHGNLFKTLPQGNRTLSYFFFWSDDGSITSSQSSRHHQPPQGRSAPHSSPLPALPREGESTGPSCRLAPSSAQTLRKNRGSEGTGAGLGSLLGCLATDWTLDPSLFRTAQTLGPCC